MWGKNRTAVSLPTGRIAHLSEHFSAWLYIYVTLSIYSKCYSSVLFFLIVLIVFLTATTLFRKFPYTLNLTLRSLLLDRFHWWVQIFLKVSYKKNECTKAHILLPACIYFFLYKLLLNWNHTPLRSYHLRQTDQFSKFTTECMSLKVFEK